MNDPKILSRDSIKEDVNAAHGKFSSLLNKLKKNLNEIRFVNHMKQYQVAEVMLIVEEYDRLKSRVERIMEILRAAQRLMREFQKENFKKTAA